MKTERVIVRTDWTLNGSEFLFLLLNGLDSLLTWAGLSLGAKEIMPLKVFASNVPLLVTVKMSVACLIIVYHRKAGSSVLWLLNFVVFAVVLWNAFSILILLAFS